METNKIENYEVKKMDKVFEKSISINPIEQKPKEKIIEETKEKKKND